MGVYYGKADFITYGKPSLLLDFANRKSLVDRISGKNLITFSRNSVGTYVGADGLIKTAGNDEARFDHDPDTLESLGLLIEESRTNLSKYSQEMNQYWNQFGSLSLNSAVAPDGTTTADKLITVNGSGFGLLNVGAEWTSGTTYTFSIFAKAAEWSRIGIRVYDGTSYFMRVTFDLTTGQTVNTESGTLRSEKLSNGWYRVSITGTPVNNQSYNTVVSVECHNTALVQGSESGTGTEGIYLWGAQWEVGAFPTSYIPTTSAAVTRSADAASITGTNFSSWFNKSNGNSTMVANYRSLNTDPGNIWSFDGGGVRWIAYWGPYQIYDGVDGFNMIFSNPLTSPVSEAAGIQFISNSLPTQSIARNGILGSTGFGYGTGEIQLTNLDTLTIGRTTNTGGYLNGTINRISYYPSKLTDAQLQSITR